MSVESSPDDESASEKMTGRERMFDLLSLPDDQRKAVVEGRLTLLQALINQRILDEAEHGESSLEEETRELQEKFREEVPEIRRQIWRDRRGG